MDRKIYEERVLAPLQKWSHLGSLVNEAGTDLIGHIPHVAPKAYLHAIYAPSESDEFPLLEERVGRAIPPPLAVFYTRANGMQLFLNVLSVAGFYPNKRKFDSHPHNYPFPVTLHNTSGRPRGLDYEAVVVGKYLGDQSLVSIEGDGIVLRYDAMGDGSVMQEWLDFDTWLISEIAYFSQFFDSEGKLTIDARELIKPHP